MWKISALLVAATIQTAQAQTYAGFNLSSIHVKPQREFNQQNFGALVGVRFGSRLQYGGEVGFYNNSYSEITRYGLAFADYPVGPVRLGVWAGAFESPQLIPWAIRSGIPHSGSFIGVVGVHAVVGFEAFDLTVRVLPGGNKSDVIITTQISWGF